MNKSAIKNFAVSARKKLIEQVMQKAFQIGITAKSITELKQEAGHIILNNIPQEKSFKLQRDKLIQEIKQKGYEQVMEEVAYTWFNRFIALRFMEVNDYLPTGVRVLSSRDPNRAEPDIIREALNLDLAVDRNVIYDFQDRNDSEGLFKYLIIHQCNDLNKILPFMFETISDYTELLFPSNLLQEGSVIRDLVTSIPEEDWKEVEIIGWLYQYYISEKKDEVFADLKKNKKITKENIPAATQLFTPKWIVQYMVENSLGRLWLESHPNEELKAQWKYYLEEAEQEPEVQKQLDELKNPNLNPIEIKALDPCCGSGHILVYAFEVLYEIYKSFGYMEEDIPKLILENNLYGLDIDDRASQLASFAVMMKARSKSRGVFDAHIKLNICAIQESNWMGNEVREILVDREAGELELNRERDLITYLADTFKDAKEYGSILDVRELDLEFLKKRLDEVGNNVARDLFEDPFRDVILEKLPGIIMQAKIMGKKYDVVCTNPPYLGKKGMNTRLVEYVKNNYANNKSDLFAVFIENCIRNCIQDGFVSMITQHSWMFLSSFEKLREELIDGMSISSMCHLGPRAFEEIGGEVVQSTAFVMQNVSIQNTRGIYLRLVDYKSAELKAKEFNNRVNKFIVTKSSFKKIPGYPIAYWITERVRQIFKETTSLSEIGTTKLGMRTGNNELFLRLWHEISYLRFNNKSNITCNALKWFPYNKGGEFRKWYGNNQYVINWNNNGEDIKRNTRRVYPQLGENLSWKLGNEEDYFKKAITWSRIGSSYFGGRYVPEGSLFDTNGPILQVPDVKFNYCLGLLCSKISVEFLKFINPTLAYQVGDVSKIPFLTNVDHCLKNDIESLVQLNIQISQEDWDSYEISWDFKKHPLINSSEDAITIEEAFNIRLIMAENKSNQLQANEEELNRIYIDIYCLQDEMKSRVDLKDVTLTANPYYRYKNKKNKKKIDDEEYVINDEEEVTYTKEEIDIFFKRDTIKEFISYAVGCMLGRYSLDGEGLIFAGGKFDPERYKTFKADADGILPVLSDAYFDDDIVTQFAEFVKVTFGDNTLATNLDYIAETLGKKANESSRECIRRYFLKDFYKDHVQMYKKRPIYWLFTSGKEQGFNALVYMHLYDSSMVSRVRTDYLHPLQNKLEAEYQRLNSVLVSEDSPTEKTKATKCLKELTKQMQELKKYDEVIHNLADQQLEIDLDDGVVANYAKFEKVLAKI